MTKRFFTALLVLLCLYPQVARAYADVDRDAINNDTTWYDERDLNRPVNTSAVAPAGTQPADFKQRNVALGQRLAAEKGWSGDEFDCLYNIWQNESGWNETIQNSQHKAEGRSIDDSAYGIPQALPGSKMSDHGADWRTNPETQIRWGLDYIGGRYKSPCNAWSFWQAHRWY